MQSPASPRQLSLTISSRLSCLFRGLGAARLRALLKSIQEGRAAIPPSLPRTRRRKEKLGESGGSGSRVTGSSGLSRRIQRVPRMSHTRAHHLQAAGPCRGKRRVERDLRLKLKYTSCGGPIAPLPPPVSLEKLGHATGRDVGTAIALGSRAGGA